jgi:hypothetical protein
MARYYSDDGVFDADVAKLWRLIREHDTKLGEIHPGVRPVSAAVQPDGSVIAVITTPGENGRVVEHTWRFLQRPPYAQTVEMLAGPMKGSWFTSTYIPEGPRTRVVTVAEWRMQGVSDEARLLKAAEEFMENGFAEDSRYLRTMT